MGSFISQSSILDRKSIYDNNPDHIVLSDEDYDKCNINFATLNTLFKQAISYYTDNRMSYIICNYCKKEYGSMRAYVSHYMYCRVDQVYAYWKAEGIQLYKLHRRCLVCEFTFYSELNYADHIDGCKLGNWEMLPLNTKNNIYKYFYNVYTVQEKQRLIDHCVFYRQQRLESIVESNCKKIYGMYTYGLDKIDHLIKPYLEDPDPFPENKQEVPELKSSSADDPDPFENKQEISELKSISADDMKEEIPNKEIPNLDCSVCMERRYDTLILPCRHSCVCFSCSKQLDQCPLCRSAIDSVIQMFMK